MEKLFSITLMLFILLTTIPSSHSNNHTDLEALLAFKNSIHDDPLHALSSWNETTHFCRWNGVSCSKRHPNRVVSVSLHSQGLAGSLSPHIGLYNLSSVEIFGFDFNRLHGNIPVDISSTLPKLRHLYLNSNNFSGVLLASLSNSSLIESIQVTDNSFTGNMIHLTRFSALQYLSTGNNRLNGDIGNILSSLTNCTNLKSLSLYQNHFTGSLPDSIGNLSNHLSFLNLHKNLLSGSIPSSIGNLISLTLLSAHTNNLKGPIPPSIGKLHKLQEISLLKNRMTHEMPFSLGNLTLLNKLYLGLNNLSGSIPQSLANCTNLSLLYLSYNNLSGSIPPEIVKLSSIGIALDLSHNILTGTIPLEDGALRNLGIMDMSHNRLSGTIPSSLGSCVMLSEVAYFCGQMLY
ncbi:probable leucine-rich repeat receptor-like protein kinase At1g35710 [Salvia hispanica]|uniref:probable leucine-rich repeat receptor-like protein kinase At1g35710 n=1 Tax=Salvia hispanica TaxID=49212 RepID=UPI0020094B03|nr:probable leucine-rich repeat receptor-like protein kinase At1g35710 [Salvia hispanica]